MLLEVPIFKKMYLIPLVFAVLLGGCCDENFSWSKYWLPNAEQLI
jgi:hypothetical protein